MNATFRSLAVCVLLLGMLTGCATPERRAKQNPAAFHKLAPSDQRLVLKGKIRPGLDRAAVFIAWGPPDWKLTGGKGQEDCESWIYYRELTTYLPFAASDVHSPSVDLMQPRFELGLRTFGGAGGLGSDGFLYSPRVLISDVHFQRADFRSGVLKRYQVRHGAHLLAPLP